LHLILTTKLLESLLLWSLLLSTVNQSLYLVAYTGQDGKLERTSTSCSWGDSHAALYFFLFYLPPSFKLLSSCFAEFLTDQWPSLLHNPAIFL